MRHWNPAEDRRHFSIETWDWRLLAVMLLQRFVGPERMRLALERRRCNLGSLHASRGVVTDAERCRHACTGSTTQPPSYMYVTCWRWSRLPDRGL